MVNEQHEKYCRLSKFENKLCGNVYKEDDDSSCSRGKGADSYHEYICEDWEMCPVPSKQIEVLEKDLMDRVIDVAWKNLFPRSPIPTTKENEYMRMIITDYIKALEAEKKPCEFCHNNMGNYCKYFIDMAAGCRSMDCINGDIKYSQFRGCKMAKVKEI